MGARCSRRARAHRSRRDRPTPTRSPTSSTPRAPRASRRACSSATHNIASNVSARARDLHVRARRSLARVPAVGARLRADRARCTGSSAWDARSRINDDVANLLTNLAEVKPTILFAVPRIFNRIYEGVNKEIAQRPGLRAADHPHRNPRRGEARARRAARADRAPRARARREARLREDPRALRRSPQVRDQRERHARPRGRRVRRRARHHRLRRLRPHGDEPRSSRRTSPGRRRLGSVGRVIPGVRVVIDQRVVRGTTRSRARSSSTGRT